MEEEAEVVAVAEAEDGEAASKLVEAQPVPSAEEVVQAGNSDEYAKYGSHFSGAIFNSLDKLLSFLSLLHWCVEFSVPAMVL